VGTEGGDLVNDYDPEPDGLPVWKLLFWLAIGVTVWAVFIGGIFWLMPRS
jgi:hypothetical protein